MENESKWITFELEIPLKQRKTDIWGVYSKQGHAVLGLVMWYPAWRKYAFYPNKETVFEQDCLRDIAKFIEDKTKEHKDGPKE